MRRESPENTDHVTREIDDIETTLENVQKEREELEKVLQKRYRLAIRRARQARGIEEKSGKLWHVLLAFYWEWQERHLRRKLNQIKQVSAKTPKKPASSGTDYPQARTKQTETFPKGTVS